MYVQRKEKLVGKENGSREEWGRRGELHFLFLELFGFYLLWKDIWRIHTYIHIHACMDRKGNVCIVL